jgi:hypothetical protein
MVGKNLNGTAGTHKKTGKDLPPYMPQKAMIRRPAR